MSAMAVAVVNYNTREQLRACLASVLEDDGHDVVVADNGSTDGSLEMLRDEYPTVRVIVNRANPGYGAASNAAIAATSSDYVLLLNSDAILQPGALDALCSHLDTHPRSGLVGPRLLNVDGTLQRSVHQFPSPLVTLLDYSWVGLVVGHVPGLRTLYLASDSHRVAKRVPWVTGAALAIRRAAFDAVGGFDPAFFMYYEEVDLSYRLAAAGWETHFTPSANVVHVGGASTSQRRDAMYAQQIAAAIQYSQRHHSRAAVALTRWVLRFSLASRLAGDTVRLTVSRDDADRRRLAENISMLRQMVRGPWQALTR